MLDTPKRILVTGAGGFIGGRVVEALVEGGVVTVIPGLRRWSTAARIGRYPVDPAQVDLMRPDQVKAAVRGVDAVVHCAVGNPEVTVEGTRHLLQAALDAGVRRVVHLSTIDVYGRAEGVVTEAAPRVRTDRAYGDSKIAAEQVCNEFVEHGLEVVILRPTIVYGPFSDHWTIEFAHRLEQGAWLLPREACQGTCNLVYVDDLVRAILLALEAPGVSGRAYNINGPERPTWQDYVEELNQRLGFGPLEPPPASSSRIRMRAMEPVRHLAKGIFRRFEQPVVTLYKRSRLARALMKRVEGTLRKTPSSAEYDLFGRVVDFPTTRAQSDLGYRPRVLTAEGIEMSAQWLVHEGVVRARD